MIICDLDGCISDDRWRRQHAKNQEWEAYHQLAHLDDFVNQFAFVIEEDGWAICTGRPIEYREMTLKWLDKHKVRSPTVLLMRTDFTTPTVDLKRKMLFDLRQTYTINAAYDDRLDICQMYFNEGVPNVFRLQSNGRCRQISSGASGTSIAHIQV